MQVTVWSRYCLGTIGMNSTFVTYIDGSAGAQFGTTFTLLNSDFAHLKEWHSQYLWFMCALEPFTNTVNIILSSNSSGCKKLL